MKAEGKAKVKSKRAVPPILPREPLTKKALAAIDEYATIKAEKDGLHIHCFMVRWVLEAERMRRVDLYAWLEARGYRWLPKYGFWKKIQKGSGKDVSSYC